MIFSLEHTFFNAAIFFLNIELCISACGRAEYEINGECCPMCSPGNHVYRHCTEFTNTTCMQCVNSTFTDEPNCLSKCISCTMCDAGQGLGLKTTCTLTSNTVCEPLEGFYCTEDIWGSCKQAVEHTKCSHGQYMRQKGTAVKDAECAECKNGTYLDGSLEICRQHTKCEDLGLTEIKPGTTMSDVECGNKIQVALIAGIGVLIFVGVALAILFIIRQKINPCADRNAGTERVQNTEESEKITSHAAFTP